jgi:hypothetical protein
MRPPWRITEIWQNVVYIAIGYAVFAPFFFSLRTWWLSEHSWPYALIGLVINLGYTLLGIRTFRGYHERVAEPRPWWRWTGRPKAGFWLAGLHVFALLGAIQQFWPRDGRAPDLPLAILNSALFVVLASGYLNSSFRLRLHPGLWSDRRKNRTARQPTQSAGPADVEITDYH